jgi:predicted transcriptional regulator of viral defense system
VKLRDLLGVVGDEPVFDTGLLLAGDVKPGYLRRQLCEWVDRGHVLQLRRGLYALAPPYQKAPPDPFLVANRLVRGSYVSLESALSHHGLIPEFGFRAVQSVTPGRTQRLETPLGSFVYRGLRPSLLHGYRQEQQPSGQRVLVATPTKALLDLLYLTPGSDDPAYLEELRLQSLDQVDLGELARMWGRPGSRKLKRILVRLEELKAEEERAVPLEAAR